MNRKSRWGRVAALFAPLVMLWGSPPAFAYSYNGTAAANYADTYWSNYNPNYPAFSDDCTNFVSQSLYAGGLPTEVAYNGHTGAPEYTTYPVYWFLDNASIYATSWTVAATLYQHLTEYGDGTLYATDPGNDTAYTDGLSQGDVLFFNWGITGNPTGTAGINHSVIQTGYGTTTNKNGQTVQGNYVDSHTNNRYHTLWSLIKYNTHSATTTIYLVKISPS